MARRFHGTRIPHVHYSTATAFGKGLNIKDLYGEKYGLGLVLAGGNAGIGRYQMA